jgi:hypothetical protein
MLYSKSNGVIVVDFDELQLGGVIPVPYCLSYPLPLAVDGLSREVDPNVMDLFRLSLKTFLKMPIN